MHLLTLAVPFAMHFVHAVKPLSAWVPWDILYMECSALSRPFPFELCHEKTDLKVFVIVIPKEG